jgi:DDE superfamily endonuclease
MHPQKTRRSRARHFTPPLDLNQCDGQARTPQRAGVFYAKLFAQALGTPIPSSIVEQITHIPPRTQSYILKTGHIRTLHNATEGPDPRGRPRTLSRGDTAAIADYLEDPNTTLEEKGAPWLDIAEQAGVHVGETTHMKPPGKRTLNTRSVQHACKRDEDIINALADEEKLLPKSVAEAKSDWSTQQLKERPYSRHWRNVYFCDEFHFGIGTQITKRIKRKRGRKYRDNPMNVHRKKVTSKDTKAKAREEGSIPMIHVFVVIGYNYRKMIPYKIPSNKNGKMTEKVYIDQILAEILPDLQGITLFQDKDSAHRSRTTLAWAKRHKLSLLTSPGNAPDLSIIESMAQGLKRKFHARRCATESAAVKRFRQIFEEEMDQKTIQTHYNWYTKRLHECQRVGGQMTKY